MKRFWEKVDKRTEDECWEWKGSVNHSTGYGAFGFNSKNTGAHRVSWIIANGEIPNGMCVMHKCDNRICVNPKHLSLGTQDDNAKDRNLKNRSWPPVPTVEIKNKVLELWKTGEFTKTDISNRVSFSRRVVSRIISLGV